MGRTTGQLCKNVVNHLNKQTGVADATCTPDIWGNLQLRAKVDGVSRTCNKVMYENDCVSEWKLFRGCERHARLRGGFSGSAGCSTDFEEKLRDTAGSIFLYNGERLHSAFK